MKRHATERLPTAVVLSGLGVLLAVFAGIPEVGLLVMPWLVLTTLGVYRSEMPELKVSVTAESDRVVVGDLIATNAHIASTGDALVTLTPTPAADFWPSGTEASKRKVASIVDVVSPDRPTDVVSELPAQEWGAHDLGRMQIDITPPYGLFRFRGQTGVAEMVRVHPNASQLRQLLTPWMVRRVAGTHRSAESARGIEYADIREFGPGDSVRDINWRVSARSKELWVSQRHPDRATDVVLLVDSFVESGHDVRTIFGLFAESSIALAQSHLGATDRVGLIEFGGLTRWVSPSTGRVQLQRLIDAVLATGLYQNAAERELPVLSPRALPPRSFVIAFSPMLDDRFIEAISTVRARGHDVAVVECVSEAEQVANADTQSARLAMRLWQAERAMMRDQFAEKGVAVAQWDGSTHIDVTLDELIRRRRRAMRVGGR